MFRTFISHFWSLLYAYDATAFFICPDCRNKFVVKIQDLGKVRK